MTIYHYSVSFSLTKAVFHLPTILFLIQAAECSLKYSIQLQDKNINWLMGNSTRELDYSVPTKYILPIIRGNGPDYVFSSVIT